jgi:hypothetical protein
MKTISDFIWAAYQEMFGEKKVAPDLGKVAYLLWEATKFDPDQPRDESGRWSETGGGGSSGGVGEGGGSGSYGDAVASDPHAQKLASTVPGKKGRMPWEMTKEEYENLPVVYRGAGSGSAQEGNVFFSNDKEIAAAHGKVRDYRVLPGARIYPDPEVEGEEGRNLTGFESLNRGSAVIHTDDVVRNYRYDDWKHKKSILLNRNDQ